MKNTCIWITSDERPAGIPSLKPEEQEPELADADREAVGDDFAPRHRGGRTKKTIGTAARKKRSAASVNGGTSVSATLIGTNV